jgi:transposase
MDAEAILAANPDLPNPVVNLIRYLVAEVAMLKARVAELEARLAKNSSNSSKPPSSDGYRKPPAKTESGRTKSGKEPGGQPDHLPAILEQTSIPDVIEIHPVAKCQHCNHDLSAVEAIIAPERRQMIDIPIPPPVVTEHRVEGKTCPQCGKTTVANFPAGVDRPVQYSNTVKTLSVYFSKHHYIPYKRLQEMLLSVFKLPISTGSLVNFVKQCAEKVKSTCDNIKTKLTAAALLHVDETGMRCLGVLYWLHSYSNADFTYYDIHKNRGQIAMEEIGILSQFHGRLIHDHWKAYFKYFCDHALCNAHHLRELTYLAKQHKQSWAAELISLLVVYKEIADECRADDVQIPETFLRDALSEYDRLVEAGFAENKLTYLVCKAKSGRGEQKRSPPENMLVRLKEHRNEVLAFMLDVNVPFDNNLAERDIRMAKLYQKISGCFRSVEGAKWFSLIKSYTSTCRKQGHDIYAAILAAFDGQPIAI